MTPLGPPEEWPILHAYSTRVNAGEQIAHFEGIGIAKDGHRLDIAISLAPTKDEKGRAAGHAAIIRDITAPKAAARALHESEEHYRRLFERNLAGVLRTSLDGSVLDCNQAIARMFGYENRAELLGQSAADFYWDARDRQVLVNRIRTESAVNNVELVLRKKNDEQLWVLANLTLIEGDHGASDILEGTLVDISKRKRYEQELIEAEECALAGSRAKSEFLAIVSHELRTPLNGIVGMIELLSDSERNQEKREYLDIAKQSAESLLATIQQLLDFTGLDNHKIELQPKVFSIAGELQSTLESLTGAAQAKELELDWRIDPRIPRVVVGDPLRLRQVVTNLVGNAIKFTDRGSVSVRLSRVSQSDSEVEIECSVCDTGIGVEDEKRRAIFEVFGQADTSVTRRHGGLGLGLPISSRLINLMGGKLRLESTVGQGTKLHFSVKLGLPVGTVARQSNNAPAVPLAIPPNWTSFRRHLNEGHSSRVEIVPDVDPRSAVVGHIWSASEGFVRAVTSMPFDSGASVRLGFDGKHHASGEVVFCQQWPDTFNIGIQLSHNGRLRREPRFPVQIEGILTALGDGGPRNASIEVVDISSSGLGIVSPQSLIPGCCVEVKTEPGIILGEVRYSDRVSGGRFRCGIKMYQLVEQDAASAQGKTAGLWKWLRGNIRSEASARARVEYT